mgnify:CR=1 FL=1
MFNKLKNSNVFTSIILPLIPMLLWGSLFPFIKIGYSTCNIDTSSIADILMFASVRFTFCGLIVCGGAFIKKEKLQSPEYKNILNIALMGVFAIVLHYSFTYVGLSLTDSSKTAILKQLGALLYVCFAFIFIKEERFSIYKIIGALVGFYGIIAINASSGGIKMTSGDVLIILASVCTVVANIMSKQFVEGNSPLWVTGVSQFTGGVILFVISVIMGGQFPIFSIKGLLTFAYICTASIIGYTVWYYVQKSADLSHLFMIKFAEPLFACVFGAILLGENIFKVQYLGAFVLISAGIILGNKGVKNES